MTKQSILSDTAILISFNATQHADQFVAVASRDDGKYGSKFSETELTWSEPESRRS